MDSTHDGTRERETLAGTRGRRAFVLALLAAAAIAALDAALGASILLVEALVAPPLVAAASAGPGRTAIVGAFCTALGVGLSLTGDLADAESVLAVSIVLVASVLSIWIAGLRDARDTESARLGVQYSVARVLSDARGLEDAVPRLLEAVGRPLGWELGGFWTAQDGVLRCEGMWSARPVDAVGFEELSRELVLEPGRGLPGRVLESGDTAFVPDVARDDNFPRARVASEAGLRAAVAFPLTAAGRIVGVVELFARDPRRPEPNLLKLMSALGGQVGEFVEGLRATEALRASEERKSAMLESALDCVISIDHEGTVLEFNPAAERTFGYSRNEVVGREMAELIIPPPLRERHRAALRRYVDTEKATLLGRRIELTGMRKDGGQFPVELSIHRIGSHSPPMFTAYLRNIADRRRAEQEREELLRLEQLARVDAAQARDQLEAILRGVADAVTAQAPDGSLLFANDAAVAMLGYETREELLGAPLTEVMSRFELVDERGRPYPVERLPGRRALKGESAEDTVRFRVVRTGEERWSLVKATPIFDAGGDVVMAINVIEDITASKRGEREASFLAESSRVLSSSLDPDVTLQRIATLAVPEIAEWCTVHRKGADGSLELLALAHRDPQRIELARRLQERYPPDPHAATGVPHVLRSGEPELYPEIPDELLERTARDAEHLQLLRDFGLRSAMIVPMISGGDAIGAISFVSGKEGRRFDHQDLALAQELARRCATALDNARLYTERAYIAKTLQESLLPAELPLIPGLETAARFHATGGGAEVGGDFYDLFQTGERGWTLVVGDVCGKGPDAAAVTALARYTLRAAAMRERLPSRSLALLNEALLRQRSDRRFCTVAYAYLEPGEQGARVGFASGGHPLPLVLRGDGETEWLGQHGTLLGVISDPALEDRSASLAPGDALVFYTDGVTEARGPGGTLSEEELRELVASCAGMGAEAIASRVEAAALEVQDGVPRDDIAVFVLRATA